MHTAQIISSTPLNLDVQSDIVKIYVRDGPWEMGSGGRESRQPGLGCDRVIQIQTAVWTI